eukprot:15822260-Heterocapsa_arctica.AAC.1
MVIARGPAGCAKRLEFVAPWGGLCRGPAHSASHLSGSVFVWAGRDLFGARVKEHGAIYKELNSERRGHESVGVTRFCYARVEEQG